MIRVILVDDERPALMELEHHLSRYPEIEVIGRFSDAEEALKELEILRPEALFLDINMPRLSGMEMAFLLNEKSPDTKIIFVTAYDQYALEAFSVHAIDYILKPIQKERLDKTIETLVRRVGPKESRQSKKLQIKCFGHFPVQWEDEPPLKWRTEKMKELFAFLLHDQGRGRTKEELLEILWPEEDPEKAIKALYNGVYYIRKALEDYGISRALIQIDNRYKMSVGEVFLDTRRFRELEKASSQSELEELVLLCKEPYFRGENYEWALLERERIERRCHKALLELAAIYEKTNFPEKEEIALLEAYELDPYEEEVSIKLIECYLRLQNAAKAKKHYLRYLDFLEKELGVRPGEKIKKLCESL